MQNNHHLMSIIMKERANSYLKEAEEHRLARTVTESQANQPSLLNRGSRLLMAIFGRLGLDRSLKPSTDRLDSDVVPLTK